MIAFGGRRGPHRSGSRCRGRPIERREAGREGCLSGRMPLPRAGRPTARAVKASAPLKTAARRPLVVVVAAKLRITSQAGFPESGEVRYKSVCNLREFLRLAQKSLATHQEHHRHTSLSLIRYHPKQSCRQRERTRSSASVGSSSTSVGLGLGLAHAQQQLIRVRLRIRVNVPCRGWTGEGEGGGDGGRGSEGAGARREGGCARGGGGEGKAGVRGRWG